MEIKGTTAVCGLMGNPVHHTLSPAIHNTLAKLMGIDMVYVPFEVKEEALESAVKGALSLDIRGLNATIPHKNAVISFMKEMDPAAELIGAVNTLVRTADGSGFKGYNTDYYGIKRTLEQADVTLEGAGVIILGAGGVSRPAAFLCAKEGASEVYILNRTVERAKELGDAVNEYAGRQLCKALPITDYDKIPKDRKYLCFQMTSVGLFPNDDEAVIEDPEFYKLVHTGFDAVYRPLKTAFLKKCIDAGAKAVGGLRVLLYQGVEAFELWNKVKVSSKLSERVYAKLLSCLLDGRNIVLTGFMGSGKSSVSRAISLLADFDVVDSDNLIEEEQGIKITEIFEKNGEEYFRDLETDALKRLVEQSRKNMVLAVGGGLPIREENRLLMKKAGTVVWLRARPETVYERVKDDTSRPLLKSGDVLGKIKQLQEKRQKIYESCPDIILDTDGKTPVEIAVEIMEMML